MDTKKKTDLVAVEAFFRFLYICKEKLYNIILGKCFTLIVEFIKKKEKQNCI